MTTFACRSCGSVDNFAVYEMTPRHRAINVEAGANGEPVEGGGPSTGDDELFYEASEFRAYRCNICGTESKTLAELAVAK